MIQAKEMSRIANYSSTKHGWGEDALGWEIVKMVSEGEGSTNFVYKGIMSPKIVKDSIRVLEEAGYSCEDFPELETLKISF
jgi:hypothetical protein